MIDLGLRYQADEDWEKADIFFTRAGVHQAPCYISGVLYISLFLSFITLQGPHSEDSPHLAKLYLGISSFKQGKYLVAVNYFSSVVSLLLAMRHETVQREDGFRAYYNRYNTAVMIYP